MRALPAAALLLAALAPTASALDVLPGELALDDHEARIVARSHSGTLTVRAEPPVLAAGVAPGSPLAALEETPIEVATSATWRGLSGVVEILLQREGPGAVSIYLEDDAVGAWVEWPAARAEAPGLGVGLAGGALLSAAALAGRRRA